MRDLIGLVQESSSKGVAFTVLFICFACISSLAESGEIVGRVISISDGDTFTLLTDDKRQVIVRLAEIDAPENGQPYSNKSKQELSRLIHGKTVRVDIRSIDRYGRTVGRPYEGNRDICAVMVRAGSAWVYREYSNDEGLQSDEANARTEKRGIWGLSEAKRMPPWEWRRFGGVDDAPEGCKIKGNISSKGVRIYHAPGSNYYSQTRIDESKGERWFCSESEANLAGWRAPRN